MANLRPMLAASFLDPQVCELELESLYYPLLASPKIDGIRWMKPPESPAMSRSWTPLPNKRFQEFMTSVPDLDFLDGEVIVGEDPTKKGLFNESQSAIMTRDDPRPFSIWVFDDWSLSGAFKSRTEAAKARVEMLRGRGLLRINYVEHHILKNPKEVLEYEEAALLAGYEGIMLRHPLMPYKYGRSTLKQQGLIKMKRFEDDEAEIIGFEALERNTNVLLRNLFGLAKRSSHKDGKIPDNLLGRLLVRSGRFGEFAIGSGFDVDTRVQIWTNQEAYRGKFVCFKFQAHGTKDKPRMPIFKGMRAE